MGGQDTGVAEGAGEGEGRREAAEMREHQPAARRRRSEETAGTASAW
ncbi:hypothetical protein [Streptomyces sp. C10]